MPRTRSDVRFRRLATRFGSIELHHIPQSFTDQKTFGDCADRFDPSRFVSPQVEPEDAQSCRARPDRLTLRQKLPRTLFTSNCLTIPIASTRLVEGKWHPVCCFNESCDGDGMSPRIRATTVRRVGSNPGLWQNQIANPSAMLIPADVDGSDVTVIRPVETRLLCEIH